MVEGTLKSPHFIKMASKSKSNKRKQIVYMIPEGETRATATYHFVKEKTGNQWSQNKKFRMKHYHPKLRKHCWFVETKMPSHSK